MSLGFWQKVTEIKNTDFFVILVWYLLSSKSVVMWTTISTQTSICYMLFLLCVYSLYLIKVIKH